MLGNAVIISAPFGNYIEYPGAISTLGTFTLHKRDGTYGWYKWYKIAKTLRYRVALQSWQNSLGLPNPGIDYLANTWYAANIVSIYGFNLDEWRALFNWFHARAYTPRALELNISCPNIHTKLTVDPRIFTSALQTGIPIIVKLPPVNYWKTFTKAIDHGITMFHCCNTLPNARGGLSGAVLHPYSVDAVSTIKNYALQHNSDVFIIGGGGIYDKATALDFTNAGANAIAIGSALINPFTRKRKLFNIIHGER